MADKSLASRSAARQIDRAAPTGYLVFVRGAELVAQLSTQQPGPFLGARSPSEPSAPCSTATVMLTRAAERVRRGYARLSDARAGVQ